MQVFSCILIESVLSLLFPPFNCCSDGLTATHPLYRCIVFIPRLRSHLLNASVRLNSGVTLAGEILATGPAFCISNL
jgi:hypothetical protein